MSIYRYKQCCSST